MARKKPDEPEFVDVSYITTADSSPSFDVLVRGVLVRGVWNDYPEKKKIRFDVPADLVEAFEMHYHFLSGNVVRYKPVSEPINNELLPSSVGASQSSTGGE
jgi:hypothetical protein